jgi:hypothetical protein
MNKRRVTVLLAALLAASIGLPGERALAATPSFTISASNVTMSATGSNVVTFTLTSVDGYSGTMDVICDPTTGPVGSTLPLCGQPSASADPQVYTLAANGTVQGSFPLLSTFPPCTGPCPVRLERPRRGFASELALAGVLFAGFGLGFRRRAARWLVLPLLVFGTLAGMAGISACGGASGRTLTPGVWPYVVQADGSGTNQVASATINVTVPAGIPVTY